jgi:hypothetical protein
MGHQLTEISMKGRTTDALRAILLAGGGVKMSMRGRTTDELRSLAIAANGSGKRPQLIFYNLTGRTDDELRAIAIAGQGCVVFSDEAELFKD